jgi:hypothetical protein
MTHEDWQAATSPKVQGTLNLHSALTAHALVLFSSLSGMGGWSGQANYAAANTSLDASVQFRHGLGLPASALVIGAMQDVGFTNPSQLAIGVKSTKPLSDPDNRASWRRNIRMAAAAAPCKPAVLGAQSSTDLLTREIAARLTSFMVPAPDDISVSAPLAALGVDSLVAIENRNWWRQNLGFEVSVLGVWRRGAGEAD